VRVTPSKLLTASPNGVVVPEDGEKQTMFRDRKPLPSKVIVWPMATADGAEVMIGSPVGAVTTVTIACAETLPPTPNAVSVYVVVCEGETVTEDPVTVPTPLFMLIVVAPLTLQ
jgi:hypothetical protein